MHIAHIDTIHIHLPAGADATHLAALLQPAHAAIAPQAIAAGQPPASGEPWPGHGGYYICTLPVAFGLPARHLILATEEHAGLPWGGNGSDCTGAASQTDGCANTRALLADSKQHPAAEFAAAHTADGHTDFHLPSRHDLLMCFLYAPQLFDKQDWYWSSSQYARYGAWCQHFGYVYSRAISKDDEFRARPVRWIHL